MRLPRETEQYSEAIVRGQTVLLLGLASDSCCRSSMSVISNAFFAHTADHKSFARERRNSPDYPKTAEADSAPHQHLDTLPFRNFRPDRTNTLRQYL